MGEKIVGYILLIAGVGIILFSGFSVYGVFSKNTKPVQFFTGENIPIEIPMVSQNPKIDKPTNEGGISISTKTIQNPLNSFAHLALMMFVGSVGFKIASLGTMLIRPIIVKLKKHGSSNKFSRQKKDRNEK